MNGLSLHVEYGLHVSVFCHLDSVLNDWTGKFRTTLICIKDDVHMSLQPINVQKEKKRKKKN